VNTAL